MESLKVRDYMHTHPVTFSPDASLSVALDTLLASKQTGGPVVDALGKVIGFISEQDMMHTLLNVGYHCQDTHSVRDCMRTDVLAASVNESIIDLAGRMVSGKPKLYPVVEGEKLVGLITRRDVLKAISAHLGACFKHPV
ncbi:CBS domain-containing protein [Thaumasiovibrio sp. DFM-14]|uniref:CBS domain-containing protein n=1 Tax=Thaumasiovibrio sp. DFM-14 TaxID=3384792 RepID=UPI0039A0A662